MIEKVTIKEAMTKNVICIHENDVMSEVVPLFEKYNIHHLPVIGVENKVVGMVSKSDFFRLEHSFNLFSNKKSKEITNAVLRSLLVKEVMAQDVTKIYGHELLLAAIDLFNKNKFHALPVIERSGKLIGILTPMDVVNCFCEKEKAFTKASLG